MQTSFKSSSFKNSTSTADNKSETENNMFEKLFESNAVSSIIIVGEHLKSFQKKKHLRMKTKNLSQTNWFIKQWQSLICMTSELFVTGGFRVSNVRKNLFQSNHEREKGP